MEAMSGAHDVSHFCHSCNTSVVVPDADHFCTAVVLITDWISDFLRKVKEAEEIGLTPAEVWRSPDGSRQGASTRMEDRTDLERCARCKRETAPENGYKTGAGFFCGPCSSEYDDGVK
jgi:hypothetical protein